MGGPLPQVGGLWAKVGTQPRVDGLWAIVGTQPRVGGLWAHSYGWNHHYASVKERCGKR